MKFTAPLKSNSIKIMLLGSGELGKEVVKKYENHKYNDIINNIANIALITKETNNNRIGSELPSVYITNFEKEYKDLNEYGEFIKIMESQFISPAMIELLKNDDFDGFIVERTKLLHQHIEELCKVKE